MFERWAHVVYRFRWPFLALSVIVLALSIVGLGTRGNVDGPQPASPLESDRAAGLVSAQLPHASGTGSSFLLLFSNRDLTVMNSSYRTALEQAIAPLRLDARVVSVVTPYGASSTGLMSKDLHEALAIVNLRDGSKVASTYLPQLRAMVHPGLLRVLVTGNVPINNAFNTTLEADLQRAELVSLPLALILLVLIFRSALAALLPIGVGVLTILGGVAGTLLLSNYTYVSQYAFNIVTLIGLGVSIDYSLMFVSRFREELQSGASREAALATTMATAGRAITFSGLTVAIGLSSLLFFRGTFLSSMGLAGALVVALAVLYSLTLLPALLAVMGNGVNRFRLPWQRRSTGRRFWYATATRVMHQPLVVLLPCLALLLAVGTPFLQLRLAGIGVDGLPPHNEARQGYDTLVADFAGYGNSEIPVVAYFPNADPQNGAAAAAVTVLTQQLGVLPGVLRVDQPQFGSHIALLRAISNLDPSSDGARHLVATIRAHSLPGGQVLVAGQTASDLDVIAFITANMLYALAFVLVVTYIVLFLMTGSVVLPLKAVVTNLLSISASFGAMVWIFQQGHLSNLLNFTAQSIDPSVPVILFALVFGLSMDYEVLLIARIQERWLATGDNTRAVAEGLERSGRLITGAAAIMIAVFLAFGLADVVLIKSIGIGIAIAIAVDATLVRALMVPAIMRLLGPLNWWAPRRLAMLGRRTRLSEAAAEPAA
jgi:putative drug exporter of the RND superfamily